MSSDTSVLALFTENDVVDLASIYKKFQVQRTEPIYHRCMFLHWSALIVLNTRYLLFSCDTSLFYKVFFLLISHLNQENCFQIYFHNLPSEGILINIFSCTYNLVLKSLSNNPCLRQTFLLRWNNTSS